MDTTLVQKVLLLVKKKFLEDFRADVTPLTYLETNRCLEPWQVQWLEAASASTGMRDRVAKLFEILGGCPNSVDVLIKFFEEEQTTQPHLGKMLKEAQTRVLNEAGQSDTTEPNGAGTTSPSESTSADSRSGAFKLIEAHIDPLVTIILQSTIALEKWGPVMYKMITSPVQQQKIKRHLKDADHDEAVRTTLHYYIGQGDPPPTMDDLLEKFLEKGLQLEMLAEELRKELGNLRKF